MTRQVIADALSYNAFKGCWSARVTLMDGDHVSIGCLVEKPTKGEALAEAESMAFSMAGEYHADIINVL